MTIKEMEVQVKNASRNRLLRSGDNEIETQ
jgi:hypothetical protein